MIKVSPECIVCLARQAIKAAKAVGAPEELQFKVLKEVMTTLTSLEWRGCPPDLARPVFRTIRRVLGVNDPYKRIKKLSNDLMLSLYDKVKEIVMRSQDPLRTAVIASIAGNAFDIAVMSEEDLMKIGNEFLSFLKDVMKRRVGVDDYDILRNKVMNSNSLLVFLDNAGEIVLDKLLLETMIKVRGEEFVRVTLVVKGGPIINDATPHDVDYVGFKEVVPNLVVKTVSNGDPGTGPDRRDESVMRWFREHDLKIFKGQGNFEALSDIPDSFFLLITKCELVARALGAKVGDVIIKYVR